MAYKRRSEDNLQKLVLFLSCGFWRSPTQDWVSLCSVLELRVLGLELRSSITLDSNVFTNPLTCSPQF